MSISKRGNNHSSSSSYQLVASSYYILEAIWKWYESKDSNRCWKIDSATSKFAQFLIGSWRSNISSSAPSPVQLQDGLGVGPPGHCSLTPTEAQHHTPYSKDSSPIFPASCRRVFLQVILIIKTNFMAMKPESSNGLNLLSPTFPDSCPQHWPNHIPHWLHPDSQVAHSLYTWLLHTTGFWCVC